MGLERAVAEVDALIEHSERLGVPVSRFGSCDKVSRVLSQLSEDSRVHFMGVDYIGDGWEVQVIRDERCPCCRSKPQPSLAQSFMRGLKGDS